MWLMPQQDEPDDFVIATGETHTVKELLEIAYGYVGLDWWEHVELRANFFVQQRSSNLCGHYGKVHRVLGWEWTATFQELIQLMIRSELSTDG